MNNKGWGLQEMLVLSLILIVALLISYFILSRNFNFLVTEASQTYKEEYSSYESKLTQQAKNYVKIKYPNRANDLVVVTYNKLKLENYIEEMYDPANNLECNGYVLVKGERFTTYLKCGSNYKTRGYNFQYE